jgi:hypothetical protein
VPSVFQRERNFSFHQIDEDKTISIAEGQQQLIYGAIKIRGELIIRGNLSFVQRKKEQEIIIPEHNENFSVKTVIENQVLDIKENQEMIITGKFKIRGNAKIRGQLTLISNERNTFDEFDCLPPFMIEENEYYFIKKNKVAYLPRKITVRGNIKIRGNLVIGGN